MYVKMKQFLFFSGLLKPFYRQFIHLVCQTACTGVMYSSK